MWVSKVQHILRDRAEHEHLRAEARCAQAWATVHRIELELPQLQRSAHTTREAYQKTLEDLPAAELRKRGPAETLDPDSVVATRRLRERRRDVVAPAHAAYVEARALLDSSLAELAHARALISVVADATQVRVVRLAEHHERRVAVYRRAYVRASAKRRRLPPVPKDEIAMGGSVLDLPTWVSESPRWEVFSAA